MDETISIFHGYVNINSGGVLPSPIYEVLREVELETIPLLVTEAEETGAEDTLIFLSLRMRGFELPPLEDLSESWICL